MERSWKIYDRCDLKNNLMQLMLIFWPVPSWGMSNMKLCTQELQFCQAQKKLAVVITDSPCYGKDCRDMFFFVTCLASLRIHFVG